MAGNLTYFESDGKSVTVDLTSTVPKDQIAYVSGFLGIALQSGDSGDSIALNVDHREYQFVVPSGLSVSKGDIVYIDTADLTGHLPDDTAWSTSAGSGKIRLCKATSAKDANNIVTGILLAGEHAS